MTVTLELSPEQEVRIKAKAERAGMSVEDLLLNLVDEAEPVSKPEETDPQEWARRFRAWADSHDPNTPVLSDEAMSRESIYPDRF